MSKYKECIVCNKKYEYCMHCQKNKINETWHNRYCSENCRDLFRLCSNYNAKLISIEEAKKQLDKLNTNVDMTDSITEIVGKINTYKKPIVKKDDVDIEEETQYNRPRRRRMKKQIEE